MLAWVLAAMIAMGSPDTITIRSWDYGDCSYADTCAHRGNFSANWYTVDR